MFEDNEIFQYHQQIKTFELEIVFVTILNHYYTLIKYEVLLTI